MSKATMALLLWIGGEPSEQRSLTWSAPVGCPSSADVERRVSELLSTPRSTATEVTARAMVHGSGAQWHVDLTVKSSTGTSHHTLTAYDCTTLAEAVALIVAVHLEPAADLDAGESPTTLPDHTASRDRTTQSSPREPEARAGEGSDSSSDTKPHTSTDGAQSSSVNDRAATPATGTTMGPLEHDEESPPRQARRHARQRQRHDRRARRSPPGIGVMTWGTMGVGALPRFDAGMGFGVALLLQRSRWEAFGQRWLPQRVAVGSDPSAGAEIGLWAGGLRGCPQLGPLGPRDRLDIPLCLSAEIGSMHAEPMALEEARAGSGFWIAGGIAPRLHWRVRPWFSVWAGLDGYVVFRAPAFRADGLPAGEDVFYRTHGWGGRGLLGIELRVPSGGVRD